MMQDYEIINADCLMAMQEMPDGCVDAIVTDPPYGLSFMGKEWDSFGTDTRQPGDEHYTRVDNPYGRGKVRYGYGSKLRDSMEMFQLSMTPIFEEALRVAKPGAHLLCFGGTRTFHRMACAIEDAGWECRDTIMYVYGSGFPKSMNVGKAIDKALGAKRPVVGERKKLDSYGYDGNNTYGGGPDHNGIMEITAPATSESAKWDGWGTCLKPAWEPIIVARKPLDGTVAHNVMTHGTGAINIDGCRVPTNDRISGGAYGAGLAFDRPWMHDEKAQAEFIERKMANYRKSETMGRFPANLVHDGSQEVLELFPNDSGRFFYCAKASKRDRGEGNDHPTVKPNALMRWLVRLVCPQGGTVLDPFMGSGSTGVACVQEGMRFVGVDMDEHYCEIANARISKEADAVFCENQ